MIVIAFLLYLLSCLKDQIHKHNLHDLYAVLEFLVLLVVSYEWPTPSASSVQFSFFEQENRYGGFTETEFNARKINGMQGMSFTWFKYRTTLEAGKGFLIIV